VAPRGSHLGGPELGPPGGAPAEQPHWVVLISVAGYSQETLLYPRTTCRERACAQGQSTPPGGAP